MSVVQQFVPLLALMLLLAIASAFFSCAEAALFSLQAEDRRKLRQGNASQRRAIDLLKQPDRLLTAILFWNLIINITFFAIASVMGIRLTEESRHTEAAATALISLFGLIVASEMLPKTLGVQQPRALASLLGLPLSFAVGMLDSVMPAIAAINRMLQRLILPQFEREPYLEINDLERAITLSTQDQQLAERERAALNNIVLLSELSAEELMRPRTQYRCFAPPVHLDRLGGRITHSGYVLVTEPDSEEIASAIPLNHLAAIPRQHIENFARPVVYVPWCATGSAVLQQLQKQQVEVAAVINEMGETIGIVTLEDMLSVLFDSASSRSARMLATASIQQLEKNRWQVTGMTNLRRLARHFGVPLSPALSLTVAGVLQENLQRMPVVGDQIDWSGFRLRVLETTHQGPVRIELSLTDPTGPLP